MQLHLDLYEHTTYANLSEFIALVFCIACLQLNTLFTHYIINVRLSKGITKMARGQLNLDLNKDALQQTLTLIRIELAIYRSLSAGDVASYIALLDRLKKEAGISARVLNQINENAQSLFKKNGLVTDTLSDKLVFEVAQLATTTLKNYDITPNERILFASMLARSSNGNNAKFGKSALYRLVCKDPNKPSSAESVTLTGYLQTPFSALLDNLDDAKIAASKKTRKAAKAVAQTNPSSVRKNSKAWFKAQLPRSYVVAKGLTVAHTTAQWKKAFVEFSAGEPTDDATDK